MSCPSTEVPQLETCRKQLLLVLEPPTVPLQNMLTLQFLLRHLAKVSQQADSNGLHPRVLGELFGPLLLRLPGARYVAGCQLLGPWEGACMQRRRQPCFSPCSPELSPDFSAVFLERLLQATELEPEQLPPGTRIVPFVLPPGTRAAGAATGWGKAVV